MRARNYKVIYEYELLRRYLDFYFYALQFR